MTQLIIKNAEESFLSLQKQCTALIEQCSKIEITDETSCQIAKQNYSMLNSQIKLIEELRVREKEPYLQGGKQIDALAKKFSEPLSAEFEAGKKKVLAFEKEKQRIAMEETLRVNAIKSSISKYSADTMKEIDNCTTMDDLTSIRQKLIVDKVMPSEWMEFEQDYLLVRQTLNDYCKAKRIAISTPQQADESVNEIIVKVAEQQIESIVAQEYIPLTKIKGKWNFALVNEASLPRELMSLDEKKVKAWLKDNSEALADGQVVNGIKFFIEESVNIR